MKVSTVFLILLGLSIAAIGGLFTVLMSSSYGRAVEQRAWPQVDAVVLSSEVEEWRHDEFSQKEYRLKILYGYEWKGEAKTGERYDFRGNANYNKISPCSSPTPKQRGIRSGSRCFLWREGWGLPSRRFGKSWRAGAHAAQLYMVVEFT
jgi:hypothetical protein